MSGKTEKALCNMPLENVSIEVRRNLNCANVFLLFLKDLKDLATGVRIILRSTVILIQTQFSTKEVLLDPLEINIHTLSCFVAREKSISFRVSITQPTEIVDVLVNGNTNFFRDVFKIQLYPKENFNIVCRTCTANLLEQDTKFERILELPSGSIEVNDFFCHHGPNFDQILVPKLDDIFYGFYYIVLNYGIVANCKIRGDHIYCKRCLQYFGEFMFSKKAVKIWSDSVQSSRGGEFATIFPDANIEKILYSVVTTLLNETNFENKLLSMQFSKILFEATFPSRKGKYAMITVMERDLEILRNGGTVDVMIKLVKSKCLKLLFKVEEDDDQPLLKFWQSDINVHCMKLPHTLFSDIIKYLNKNSKLIPEMYRNSNGFLLSYVFYPT